MAEFWEQQLMDRLLELCFEYKKQDEEKIPAEQIQAVMDYVKFLIHNANTESGSDTLKVE